ncbi:MAG: polyphosphate kinase 2 family protein, partial [Acidobacteria bacterium]|nr:polyphosphate kinase 2 family protein [Acidobacteriota bacterium]
MNKIYSYQLAGKNKVSLSDYDPDDTGKFHSKAQALRVLAKHQEKLFELQELLYADASRALLVVLQGMDAAGKDGTIRHIFTGVNPQGCQVTSFKVPSPEELQHDFLWRVHRAVPARGMIGIFNRSHYEEVLVPRVRPELLEVQRLPTGVTSRKHFWDDRLESIAAFERHLDREGTVILKFFLNISK